MQLVAYLKVLLHLSSHCAYHFMRIFRACFAWYDKRNAREFFCRPRRLVNRHDMKICIFEITLLLPNRSNSTTITRISSIMLKKILLFFLPFSFADARADADDGYRLWLNDLLKNISKRAEYKRFAGFIQIRTEQTPIVRTAQEELKRGLEEMPDNRQVSNTSKKAAASFFSWIKPIRRKALLKQTRQYHDFRRRRQGRFIRCF